MRIQSRGIRLLVQKMLSYPLEFDVAAADSPAEGAAMTLLLVLERVSLRAIL